MEVKVCACEGLDVGKIVIPSRNYTQSAIAEV